MALYTPLGVTFVGVLRTSQRPKVAVNAASAELRCYESPPLPVHRTSRNQIPEIQRCTSVFHRRPDDHATALPHNELFPGASRLFHFLHCIAFMNKKKVIFPLYLLWRPYLMGSRPYLMGREQVSVLVVPSVPSIEPPALATTQCDEGKLKGTTKQLRRRLGTYS